MITGYSRAMITECSVIMEAEPGEGAVAGLDGAAGLDGENK
jgi:hypothetical protein